MARRAEPEWEQGDLEAATWALAEVEAQLGTYPAHRLRQQTEIAHWSLDAPNGRTPFVEVTIVRATADTVVMNLSATVGGGRRWFRRAPHLDRTIELRLDGAAARVPDPVCLVFEADGTVSGWESIEEMEDEWDAADLADLRGAFTDRGEVLRIVPGPSYLSFSTTGAYDRDGLASLMRASDGPQHLLGDPHAFAVEVWRRD